MTEIESIIRRVLDGIDRDELEEPEGGWWQSAWRAEWGKEKLEELIKEVNNYNENRSK